MVNGPSPSVRAPQAQLDDTSHKPPAITRKVTACVACRKQKIKCYMKGDQPPCTRCQKRGLPCSVNRSLQMILESDASWREATDRKIKTLETVIGKIARQLPVPDLMGEDEDDNNNNITVEEATSGIIATAVSRHPGSQNEQPTTHDFKIVMDPDSGPAAIPGSVVSPVPAIGHDRRHSGQDLITRGLISVQQAQNFLDIYQDRLDHFLYRIIGDRRTLDQVRSASPLLTAAICAVAALHAASPDYDKCYQEFVQTAAAQTFSSQSNVDDVRGLCIAAFWLSAISWTCIGAAVRIATELQLHRSIFRALAGDRGHYSRTRLFYLVYVCDHQSSIPYGRPPMIGKCDAVRASLRFLETEHAAQDDSRLVCQVQLWSICTDIYEAFGVDVETPLDSVMIEQLRRFSIQISSIRAEWTERLLHNQYVGNYPKKGVGLHYHFANLYLCSMAFRGIGTPSFKSPDIALDIDEIADSALLSATAIIRTVIADIEIQEYLNGLPTYFDVMIAFAAVFVLKVSTTYVTAVRVDTEGIRKLVTDLVAVLKLITATMHPRHLLVSVANGVEILLLDPSFAPQASDSAPLEPHFNAALLSRTDDNAFNMSPDWNATMFDHFSIGEFDFLLTQGMMDITRMDA